MSEWTSVKAEMPQEEGEYIVVVKLQVFPDLYTEKLKLAYYSTKQKKFLFEGSGCVLYWASILPWKPYLHFIGENVDE